MEIVRNGKKIATITESLIVEKVEEPKTEQPIVESENNELQAILESLNVLTEKVKSLIDAKKV